jgi:fumarylpyruvate hydrolase
MSEYIFPPQPQAKADIYGDDRSFPVRRIFCVGRNYAAHAREMGFDDREPPFFFSKPADALVQTGAHIPYPPITSNFHYEIELVLGIGKDGANIPIDKAFDHIWGAGVGIDFTRRDQQKAHREKGRPWDWGKAFDKSAPLAPMRAMKDIPDAQKDLSKGRIWLSVNDEIKQDACLSEQTWNVSEIIAFCSQSVTLKRGDLIFTGTPSGVGAVVAGDVIKGGIEGLGEIEITLTDAG